MSDYDYANELIEQCEKAQMRTEAKITDVELKMQKLSRERSALIERRNGILMSVSMLKVHVPSSWCRFCKRDCPKPWNHIHQCNRYEANDCAHEHTEERTIHGLSGEFVTHCLDCGEDVG